MDTTELLYKLRHLLSINRRIGPLYHGREFIKLQCRCEFEGFGRASEAWDEVWKLELPFIAQGNGHTWQKHFCYFTTGHSPKEVLQKAIAFVESSLENGTLTELEV